MTGGEASSLGGPGRFSGGWPADARASMLVLDAGTGNHGLTQAMLRDRRWPGAELASPDVGSGMSPPLVLVQATTMPMPGAIGGMGMPGSLPALKFPPIGGAEVERLASGALRIGGTVLTAATLLHEMDEARERGAVQEAIARFRLDASQATDVLAARAYVWTKWMAPFSFGQLPFNGPLNEEAAVAVMRYEQAHPGTAGLATRGNTAAIASIDVLVDDVVDGVLQGAVVEYRPSKVDPALSTRSSVARALVRTTQLQQWEAHHLLPFNVVAALPVPVQLAIAKSGWAMDSTENVIALPANMATFLAPPNSRMLPIHRGSHAYMYDADAAGLLATLVVPNAAGTPAALRASLLAVEERMQDGLFARLYHIRVH